ncbi:Myb-like dna-binding protein [Globisporangium polare]
MNDIARYPVFAFPHAMATQQPQQAQVQQRAKGIWSTAEHDRFLDALKTYPLGPWKAITDHIGSRSIRQVQTHAQKYQEKVMRRLNGSSKAKVLRLRQEHRIDHDVLDSQTLISTPGERRRSARKASTTKLNAVAKPTGAHAAPGDRAVAAVGIIKEEEEEEEGDEVEEEPAEQMSEAELFRLSLSEFDDDDDDLLVLKKEAEEEAEADEEEDEGDLPSLSECLDFFIKCFSTTAQQQQHH